MDCTMYGLYYCRVVLLFFFFWGCGENGNTSSRRQLTFQNGIYCERKTCNLNFLISKYRAEIWGFSACRIPVILVWNLKSICTPSPFLSCIFLYAVTHHILGHYSWVHWRRFVQVVSAVHRRKEHESSFCLSSCCKSWWTDGLTRKQIADMLTMKLTWRDLVCFKSAGLFLNTMCWYSEIASCIQVSKEVFLNLLESSSWRGGMYLSLPQVLCLTGRVSASSALWLSSFVQLWLEKRCAKPNSLYSLFAFIF